MAKGRKCRKKQRPVNIRFVAKISDIRNFSQNIRSGNTLSHNMAAATLRANCWVIASADI